jgi:hypothetical protein
MTLRSALGVLFLTSVSCITGGAGAPPAAPTSQAASTGGSGTGQCGEHAIKSKSDHDACKVKCSDEQRDQQRSCSNPGCQAGIGAATGLCMGKCDDGKKAAEQAKCYAGT